MHVLIDIVPMAAGRGGTGSGIWTYTVNLLRHLDACCPQDMEIGVCLRRGQEIELGFPLRRLKIVEVKWPGKGIVSRLLWVHLILPLVCLWKQVAVLHKLATDTPLWSPARRVTTLHDFYYEFLMENTKPACVRWYERLERCYFDLVTSLCFRRSRRLIAVSGAVRDEAVRRHPDYAKRITVVHHGAPWDQKVDAKGEAIGSPKIFVYVAKFMAHKGQLDAILAFEQLANLRPALAAQLRLHFRGFSNDREYYDKLNESIKNSPLAQQIKLIHYQVTDGLQEIYQGATGALLLSQYEGFGFPVVEAQGLGVPLICSDLPVFHEIAGDAALFVKPDDPGAVAGAMARLMDDVDYTRSLRAQGLVNVRRFTWEETAHKTLAVYRDTLAE